MSQKFDPINLTKDPNLNTEIVNALSTTSPKVRATFVKLVALAGRPRVTITTSLENKDLVEDKILENSLLKIIKVEETNNSIIYEVESNRNDSGSRVEAVRTLHEISKISETKVI